MSSAGPVKPQSRLEFVDILRGFALFGVLAANMSSFSGYSSSPADYADFLDGAILIGIQFLVRAKFYSLFAFLFGWGMSVQMLRAAEKGVRFVPIYARRMAILLMFGLIHGMFIWSGDILTLYALLGFALLLFRNRSERTLLIATALFLLLTIILTLPGAGMDALRDWYAGVTAFMRQGNLPDSLLATGTYLEIVPKTMQDYFTAQSWTLYFVGSVFSMFLLGLYVGKRGIFQNVEAHLPLLKRTLLVGLLVGLICNAIFVWSTLHPAWVEPRYERLVRVGSRAIGAPALMLFYVSGVTLLTRRQEWLERLRPLGSLGRMALTNYLAESLLCVLIFYGFGLGLYGQTDPTFGLILTVLILLAQIRYSRWHLARYQFGPAEWLWRSLTYGRRQPWRVAGVELYTVGERDRKGLWGRMPPLFKLGIAWILLAAWAAGLFLWYNALSSARGPMLSLLPQATATPVPNQAAQESGEERRPLVVATPQVEPAVYAPGALAGSGDMLALAQAFDVARAQEEIELLSSPPYDGRRAGSAGGLAAGDYLAEQFAALGLQPAGDEGTFFHTFPISYTNLAAAPQFSLTLPDGAAQDAYAPYEDYVPLAGDFVGAGQGSGDVVWVNRCTHDDFGRLDVVGKIALCQLDADRASFSEVKRGAVEHGAAGLLLATDPRQRPPDMGGFFYQAWIPEPIPALRVYPRLVDDLFIGSGSTITQSLLLDAPRPLATQVDLAVETLGDKTCPAVTPGGGCTGRNVLGVLPGRDPAFAGEVVIIGAHYDHLGAVPSDGRQRIIWAGANDNASGTAALLEIARTWHEEGFVPRRTVLFAAWDAEEMGLLGSLHYVQQPQYPLDQTVGMLQLDMIGAGGDYLNADGSEGLVASLQNLAGDMEIPLRQIRMGRSDHQPFLEAGVPAAMLIWLDENGGTPTHYHRPADTPQVIEPRKLEQAGELAAALALNLAESEPALLALLGERSAAAETGDREAFLATSLDAQAAVDTAWLADLQARDPLTVTISAANLQISGDTAAADTTISAVVSAGDGRTAPTQTIEGSLPVRFTRLPGGWRWAGPDLDQLSGEAVTLAYPAGLEVDFSGAPADLRRRYADIAAALGQPSRTPFTLQLFSDAEALRSSTALFMDERQTTWIGPGIVRMVYDDGFLQGAGSDEQPEANGQAVEEALVRLALANAGIAQEEARWLWDGLPLAWRARTDPAGVQSVYLPLLDQALANDLPLPEQTAAWAAADYALRQAGWDGVLDYQQTDAWQDDWQARLAAAQAALDELLAQRTAAILAGDRRAFLATAVPELAAAQERWLAVLEGQPLHAFAQAASPLAFLQDGSLLARVSMVYEFDGQASQTAEMAIRFAPGADGYLWAGKLLRELPGDTAVVRYPDGYEEQAAHVQEQASAWVPELAATLALSPTLPVTIELYDQPDDLRAAIALPYAATSWTEAGQAITMQAGAGDGELANLLARRLLAQEGIEEEWLLRGVSAFLAASLDGGVTQRTLAASWPALQEAAVTGELPELPALASPLESTLAEDALAQVAAWDAVRTYVHQYGWPALLQQMGRGWTPAAQNDFQALWAESVARGHIRPEWLALTATFDTAAAMADVEALAAPELAGRLAGTPGAEQAAQRIAGAFRDAGLLPAGENGTFLQTVPITASQIIEPVQLELNTAEQVPTPFAFRTEFLPLYGTVEGAPVSGPLYFVQDGADLAGVDFQGGIVVRQGQGPAAEEVRLAEEHGAGGLILTGVKRDGVDLYGKTPDALLPTATIPVVELTQEGTAKLLITLGLDRSALRKLEPVQNLEAEALLHFGLTEPQPATTSNVLALLPGSDPLLTQETIILGAHYDFVGDDWDGRRYGGANEATGVAALLAIARMWQESGYQPQRTILFAAWGGGDLGRAGSQYYVSEPARPLADTIALVAIEGIGGGKGISLGAQGDEAQDGWLLHGMETAAAQLGGKLVVAPDTDSGDHLSFAGQGFPRLLISWRLAGDDNLATEVAYGVEAENVQFAAQSAALLIMSLAQ